MIHGHTRLDTDLLLGFILSEIEAQRFAAGRVRGADVVYTSPRTRYELLMHPRAVQYMHCTPRGMEIRGALMVTRPAGTFPDGIAIVTRLDAFTFHTADRR